MKLLYKDSINLKEENIIETAYTLLPYLSVLEKVASDGGYERDESSINLPFDEKNIWEVYKLKNKLTSPGLKYVFVVGIGGSNLGTRAIYDALYGHYDLIDPARYPKLIFLDTINPLYINRLQNFITTQALEPEDIVINAVCKSGNTIETIVNLEELLKMKPAFKDRLVVTTSENSKFWQEAQKQGVKALSIPERIGGRFSVFSNVGLFPLSFLKDVNLLEIFSGAMEVRQSCLNPHMEVNPAAISASILYLSKKPININFFFNPELESLGKWYRQLMGESMGKINGAITPSVAIGTNDLHSVLQLYLGGPDDKVTTFIYTDDTKNQVAIPTNRVFPNIYPDINSKDTKIIIDAILTGVKKSYKDEKLPYMELILNEISEKDIGKFMQFKMIEMMFLCKLFNVNTFDQPQVEMYKVETKKNLNQPSKMK